MDDRTSAPFNVGVVSSVFGHLLALFLVLFVLDDRPLITEPEIYSVTVEAGKSLGGISQVPDKENTQVAPPVSAKTQENLQSTPVPQPTAPPEDAEVSLASPTPTPTPVPTPKATATPAPSAKPTASATPKATPTPKKPKDAAVDVNKDYAALLQRYKGASTEAGGKGFGAAKLGGTGFGGGVIRPPEFFRYSDLLRTMVKKGWRWNDNSANLVAIVVFSIAPDGRISNIRIIQSSGNSAYDMTVQRAVAKADPVPAPPESVYEYFREVKMTFDPRED